MRSVIALLTKSLIVTMLLAGVVACGDDDNSVISPPAPTPESGS